MESVKPDFEEPQKQEQEDDQIVSTADDLIIKMLSADEGILVEEVSEVEAVKVSSVVDASAAVVIEETSSSTEETTLELQSLEKSGLDELSNLIDFNASNQLNEVTGDDIKTEDANSKLEQSGNSDAAATATTKAAEDIDTDAAKSSDKKKKSSKEPARKSNGKQSKAKGKAAKVVESVFEDDVEDMPEYEVEKIVGHRTFKSKVVKYEVKWKGYSSSDNTIENAITMHDDVPELCAAYWATCKDKRPDNVPHVPTEEIQTIIEEQRKPKETGDVLEPKPAAKQTATAAASPSSSSSKAKAGSSANNESQSHTSANTTPPSKRKRTGSGGGAESPSFKKFKKNMEHIPDYMIKLGYQFPAHWPNKKTEWSVDVKKVCVQASPVDGKVMFTYLEWNNGERTIHPMAEAHEMIPEKVGIPWLKPLQHANAL
ncbi:hypothetical protein [Parasitella parasitica]|uniref:Chromo domain-containing protein n=1 Tax=Parasitella parasitica TaxID=35722 RepID=A0A0B7NGY0_9FUNG|nr:hypothetical protein [Parasitella parasitica]